MTIGSNINMLSLNLQKNLAKLSASTKIDNKDDKISHREIESSISSKSAEIKNFNNAVGFMQIADGALSSLSKQNTKLQELSVAKGDASLNSNQQEIIDSQMSAIKRTMTKTIDESSYNGINVFNSGAFNDSGVNISLNANNIDTNNLDSIRKFQENLEKDKSSVGSFMNNSKAEIENLSNSIVNENKLKSSLEVDFAKESINFANNKNKLNPNIIANSHNTDSLKNIVTSLLA